MMNKRQTAWLPWVFALLVLSGCAPTPIQPPTPPADSAEGRWRLHRAQVTAISDWSIAGRIAVKADDEGYHASLNWRQRGEDFDLRVSGPFAQGGLRLKGNTDGVVLHDSAGGQRRARDGDALLAEATGFEVPVTGLRYWVRGLPAPGPALGLDPGKAADWQLDTQGRLRTLTQNGWSITYRDYVDVDTLSLPRKLVLKRPDLSVKLIIDQWRL